MRQWLKMVSLGAASVLLVAMPAIAQEGEDHDPPFGPPEMPVQATEQYRHQLGDAYAEEAEVDADQIKDRDRLRLRDGSCVEACDGTPDRDRDQIRLRDGSCGSDCDGEPDRDRLRLRDGSCSEDVEATLDEVEGTPDRDRLRLRDGSCSEDCDGTPDRDRDRDRDCLHIELAPEADGRELAWRLMRCAEGRPHAV